MKIIRMGLYLLAEAATLYVLLVGAVFAFFWFGTSFSDTVQLIFLFFAVASVPFVLVAVTIGPHWMNGRPYDQWIYGIYSPLRPLAFVFHAKAMIGGKGENFGARETFAVDLPIEMGADARQILTALEAEMHRLRVTVEYDNSLRVVDGAAKWCLARGADDFTLEGWVETKDEAHRAQILAGIEEFILNRAAT